MAFQPRCQVNLYIDFTTIMRYPWRIFFLTGIRRRIYVHTKGDLVADEAVLNKIRAAEKKSEDILSAAEKEAEKIVIEAKRDSVKLLEESESKINESEEEKISSETSKIQKKKSEEIGSAKLNAENLRNKSLKNVAKAEKFLFEKFLGTINE